LVSHPRTRELLQYLDEQRQVLRAAFEEVPIAVRERQREPGRWSAVGVIEHLAIVESRIATRIEQALADAVKQGLGRDPDASPILPTLPVGRVVERTTRVSAPDPVHPTGIGGDAAWRDLEQAGTRIREILSTADGLDLSSVVAPHALFGPMSLYAWFAFVAAHEGRHAHQIHEIAATFV
jgi:hypothetical protein